MLSTLSILFMSVWIIATRQSSLMVLLSLASSSRKKIIFAHGQYVMEDTKSMDEELEKQEDFWKKQIVEYDLHVGKHVFAEEKRLVFIGLLK